jgi:hypothetical protein
MLNVSKLTLIYNSGSGDVSYIIKADIAFAKGVRYWFESRQSIGFLGLLCIFLLIMHCLCTYLQYTVDN